MDIADERQAQERRARPANIDELAGLGNRNYLLEKLQLPLGDESGVDSLVILYVDIVSFIG
ncbi:hypothetical protein [Burkholderia sp. JP2-270]|uniref:hypothetical protein n=1 Tax=Burkholderia sp. JP2-270 TaxID=2217913 RepID=UPI0013A6F4B8|nr:hypothetical protein [Burkholderia sp. JP2-270]